MTPDFNKVKTHHEITTNYMICVNGCQPILIRISMNASIMRTHIFH